MSRIACWFVRASLLNLAVGAAIGAALLWDVGLPYAAWPWRLLPLHRETLLFGWLAQITMGTASWILPRSEGRKVPGPGTANADWPVVSAWASLGLMNLGIVLSAAGGGSGREDLAVAGKTAEALSALAFVFYLWPRVRGLASQNRPRARR